MVRTRVEVLLFDGWIYDDRITSLITSQAANLGEYFMQITNPLLYGKSSELDKFSHKLSASVQVEKQKYYHNFLNWLKNRIPSKFNLYIACIGEFFESTV